MSDSSFALWLRENVPGVRCVSVTDVLEQVVEQDNRIQQILIAYGWPGVPARDALETAIEEGAVGAADLVRKLLMELLPIVRRH